MTTDKLEKGCELKDQISKWIKHKEDIEHSVKNSRDQYGFRTPNGNSQLEIGWTQSRDLVFLFTEFVPMSDTLYMQLYLGKLEQKIKALETEFANL